jgi:hypothetical protein
MVDCTFIKDVEKRKIRKLRIDIETEYNEIEKELEFCKEPEKILELENKRKSLAGWIGAYTTMPAERYLLIKHLL